jgi:hypothetical protein
VGMNWQDSKFLRLTFRQDRRKNSNGSGHEHRIFSIALAKSGCIHRGASEAFCLCFQKSLNQAWNIVDSATPLISLLTFLHLLIL